MCVRTGGDDTVSGIHTLQKQKTKTKTKQKKKHLHRAMDKSIRFLSCLWFMAPDPPVTDIDCIGPMPLWDHRVDTV